MAAGEGHIAAASLTGDFYVWGENHHGQCAEDSGKSCLAAPSRAGGALAGAVARRVACGRYHTVVLAADGAVYSFGASMSGQLGRQCGWPAGPSWQPGRVSFQEEDVWDKGGAVIVQVACGDEHTLCLTDAGRVFAFGGGDHGQLALGGVRSYRSPVLVRTLGRIQEITAGGTWSLARGRCGKIFLAGRGEDDPDGDCRLLRQIVTPRG